MQVRPDMVLVDRESGPERLLGLLVLSKEKEHEPHVGVGARELRLELRALAVLLERAVEVVRLLEDEAEDPVRRRRSSGRVRRTSPRRPSPRPSSRGEVAPPGQQLVGAGTRRLDVDQPADHGLRGSAFARAQVILGEGGEERKGFLGSGRGQRSAPPPTAASFCSRHVSARRMAAGGWPGSAGESAFFSGPAAVRGLPPRSRARPRRQSPSGSSGRTFSHSSMTAFGSPRHFPSRIKASARSSEVAIGASGSPTRRRSSAAAFSGDRTRAARSRPERLRRSLGQDLLRALRVAGGDQEVLEQAGRRLVRRIRR